MYGLKHVHREPAPTIWEAAAAVPEGAGIFRPAIRPYSIRPQAKAWCMRSRVTISRTVLYLSGDGGGGKQGSGSATGCGGLESNRNRNRHRRGVYAPGSQSAVQPSDGEVGEQGSEQTEICALPPPPLKMLTSTHYRCNLPTTTQGPTLPTHTTCHTLVAASTPLRPA